MKIQYYLLTVLLTTVLMGLAPQVLKAQTGSCEIAYKQLLNPATRYQVAQQIEGQNLVIKRQQKPLRQKLNQQPLEQNSYRKSLIIKVKEISYGTGVVRLKYGQGNYLAINQLDDFVMNATDCRASNRIVHNRRIPQTKTTSKSKNYGISATYLNPNKPSTAPLVSQSSAQKTAKTIQRTAKITAKPEGYGVSNSYLVNAEGKRLTFPVAQKVAPKKKPAKAKKTRSVWKSYRTPASPKPQRIVLNNQPPNLNAATKRPPVFSCTGGKCFAKLIDFCKNNNYLERNGQTHRNINNSSSSKWMK